MSETINDQPNQQEIQRQAHGQNMQNILRLPPLYAELAELPTDIDPLSDQAIFDRVQQLDETSVLLAATENGGDTAAYEAASGYLDYFSRNVDPTTGEIQDAPPATVKERLFDRLMEVGGSAEAEGDPRDPAIDAELNILNWALRGNRPILAEDVEAAESLEPAAQPAAVEELPPVDPKARLDALLAIYGPTAKHVSYVYGDVKGGHRGYNAQNNLGLEPTAMHALLDDFTHNDGNAPRDGSMARHEDFNEQGFAHRIVTHEPDVAQHPELKDNLEGKIGIGYTHMTEGNNTFGRMHNESIRGEARGSIPLRFALFVEKEAGQEIAEILKGNPELVEHFAVKSLEHVIGFAESEVGEPLKRPTEALAGQKAELYNKTTGVHFADSVNIHPDTLKAQAAKAPTPVR